LAGILNHVQLPLPIPVRLLIQPDWRLLLYSVVIALASALVAGLLPALKATRGGVSAALKRTERQVEGRWSLRGGLIVMQLAVSVVLLTMGVLFVRNMTKSMTMSPGFDADGAVWASVRLVPEKYPTEEQVRRVPGAFLGELRALPGVEAASVDRKGSPEVAILNENLARRLFGDRNPVGRTFRYPAPRMSDPLTVVGVAAN